MEKRRYLVVHLLLIGLLATETTRAEPGESGILRFDENNADPACPDYDSVWDRVLNWQDVMDAHGYPNGADNFIKAPELTDSTRVSWGNDRGSLNIDENDITLLATHGGVSPKWHDSDDGKSVSYSIDFTAFLLSTPAGNGHTTPGRECLSYGREMLLANGHGDAEFVHVVGCQSFQWEAIGTPELVGLHRKLHQYGGFHGSVPMTVANYADDFAEDAFDIGVASAWLLNMHYTDTACPVVYVAGNDEADAEDRYDNETYVYPAAYADPDTTPFRIYDWYSGCNPPHGSIMP